ncbi:GntR family transcriptional regulator [Tessaracoccus sp. HDW20]|nr:GntR family transcriptional regulator [Tessaracoccus coleopterorum]
MTELDLAAEHGVSRTPAREAMLQLEAWGSFG